MEELRFAFKDMSNTHFFPYSQDISKVTDFFYTSCILFVLLVIRSDFKS